MSKRMKVAFGCYLLVILTTALMGLIYLFRMEFMPYHAVALGKSWADIDPSLRVLLLALMRAVGGAVLATAVAMAILLFIPFRQGLSWARWAIPLLGTVVQLPALYAMASVAIKTSAQPPWIGSLISIALLIAGFILSMKAQQLERPAQRQSWPRR